MKVLLEEMEGKIGHIYVAPNLIHEKLNIIQSLRLARRTEDQEIHEAVYRRVMVFVNKTARVSESGVA